MNENTKLISEVYYRELQSVLLSGDPVAITHTRGRYIRALTNDIKITDNEQLKNNLIEELSMQRHLHQQQLNTRLATAKSSPNNTLSQVTNEFAIKINKIANNISQVASSRNGFEGVQNSFRLIGNITSTVFTVAKLPIVASLRLTGVVLPVVASIAVQPIQIPAYLFSKIINPDAPYNGHNITEFGHEFGRIIGNGLNVTADIVRRI